MAGVEQIVSTIHLHDGAGADPGILTAAAGGLQNRLVDFGISDKIGGGGQINGVVIRVAAVFQIVDVVNTVLIVRHAVAYIGLLGSVHTGEEVRGVLVGRFLTAGASEGGEILIITTCLDLVGSFRIPQRIQGQIGFHFVFREIPGDCHCGILIPAPEHIALPDGSFRLLDLLAAVDDQRIVVFAAMVIAFETNLIRSAGGTAAKQQTQRHTQGQ